MYVFYGDESGFSKGWGFEAAQPITVYAGILVDLTKLRKAIQTHDEIIEEINESSQIPIRELKFTDFKECSKEPYKSKYHNVENRCDLLSRIVTTFQSEINFKLIYSAIHDDTFLKIKRAGLPKEAVRLTHPFLAAAYRVISRIEHIQQSKPKNKGNTFVILDEQNAFQEEFENLVVYPIHKNKFTQIIDTAYFGKSHHSKLIQITDLMAGIIRYHLTAVEKGVNVTYFHTRMAELFSTLHGGCVATECFADELKRFYGKIEIKIPKTK